MVTEQSTDSGAAKLTSPSDPSDSTESQKPQFKSNNPFANGSFAAQLWSTENPEQDSKLDSVNLVPYSPTSIPQHVLRTFPFKTSNRIFEDLKLTPAFFRDLKAGNVIGSGVMSLLNSRPIAYSKCLTSDPVSNQYETIILNNAINYVPSVEKKEIPEKELVVTTIRGLVVWKAQQEINHFKILIVERSTKTPFNTIDKHEYHVISPELVSADDLEALNDTFVPAKNLIDDAFFKSLNSTLGHIMRVTVYAPEFTAEDLKPFTDQGIIKERYLKGIESNPSSTLKADLIPNPIHCLQTLIKVLKGPILLPPTDPIHTISKSKTSLDAKIDMNLLFDKLSFTMGADEDSLVPPNLALCPTIKEGYIRKVYELLLVGKYIKISHNDFDVNYSFSDNMAAVHSALAEVDKHSSLTLSRTDNACKFSFYVSLSCSSFYQDELIIRCYENTVNSDPVNKLYYVDCFKKVMSYRSSSTSGRLLSYYNNQFSKGLMYGFSEYNSALKTIGIECASIDTEIDDEVIIGMYKNACKTDSKNYTYFNRQLRVIATIRESEKLFEYIANELIPTQTALEELRIEEVTEDDVVVTAYEFRLDEVLQSANFNSNSPDILFLHKCLLSIAVGRKSYILMNYMEMKIPDMLKIPLDINFHDALRILDTDPTSSDFEVISKFQEKLSRSSFGDDIDVRTLRYCLRIIAAAKKSDILASFLLRGKIDSSLLPPENWPAGLDNIGNTCYLNSLLQYYFCIKPLRDTILNFDEANVNTSKQVSRKIGGRSVEDSELNRSFQFIYRLQNLFDEMIVTKKRCVQPSKELVYLSFLPLSQPVTFKEDIIGNVESEMEIDKEDEGMSDKENDPIVVLSQSPELSEYVEMRGSSCENLIELAQEGERDVKEEAPETPGQLAKNILSISTDQMESTIEVGRQQDVTECIENVTFQIETALEPERVEEDGEQYDLVKKLFCGRTKQTITPLEGDGEKKSRVSFERFFSLIINVSDHPKDIYDSLDNYFSEDVVHLEEGKVKKSLTIQELPEVLQFHVQRVMFDREKLMAYKSLEVIPFGETIYLDRYLETDDIDIKNKRLEVFQWKSEMRKLHEEKDAILLADAETKLSVVDALKATKKFLETKVLDHETLLVKQETIDAIQNQIEAFKARLQTIHEKLDSLQGLVTSQFSSYQKVGYSLFAIFIHRGEASYGHYWVYIKDPVKNIYRKYNDDTVTEVPASEVLNFTEGNTATPYYMVYVKDELKEQYIEPLKRVIVETK